MLNMFSFNNRNQNEVNDAILVSTATFEKTSHLFLVFFLVDIEQVNVSWDV